MQLSHDAGNKSKVLLPLDVLLPPFWVSEYQKFDALLLPIHQQISVMLNSEDTGAIYDIQLYPVFELASVSHLDDQADRHSYFYLFVAANLFSLVLINHHLMVASSYCCCFYSAAFLIQQF